MTKMRFILNAIAAVALLVALFATPVVAQNPYAPAARVNEQVVTNFEVDQRLKFMALLGAGNDRQKALEALVNERLQLTAAVAAGINLTDEQVQTGMEEFAGRANLSAADFIKALQSAGVAAETFRDFVKSGLAWRELVRAKFGPRAQITESEIDRAIAQSSSKGGLRVLLSEIILPAHTPAFKARSEKLAAQITKVTSTASFSSFARRYSASPSARRGGKLDWMPLSNLPAQIRGQILALSPGQVSAPIPITNGIVLFQLRAIEETEAAAPKDVSLEYATYFIPGGQSEAALKAADKIKARVDTCDDLYGINKGQPEDLLQIETRSIAEVPKDIALELAKLDPGEVSTRLTRNNGQTLVLLMLCGRTPELGEDVSRETIRSQLVNQRLQSYADGYLAELKADAHIVYP